MNFFQAHLQAELKKKMDGTKNVVGTNNGGGVK